jgi:hypothetical protein
MIVDGREVTTGDFEAHKRKIEAANPGKHVQVDAPTDKQIDRRIEDRKQRLANSRKARGIDVQAVGESRSATAAKELEALERGSVSPKVVAKARQKAHKVVESYKNPA